MSIGLFCTRLWTHFVFSLWNRTFNNGGLGRKACLWIPASNGHLRNCSFCIWALVSFLNPSNWCYMLALLHANFIFPSSFSFHHKRVICEICMLPWLQAATCPWWQRTHAAAAVMAWRLLVSRGWNSKICSFQSGSSEPPVPVCNACTWRLK